jgi:hypothetical protein
MLLQQPEHFNFPFPMDEGDIESIVARIKSMSLAAYAEGYTFQMKAVRATSNRDARHFYELAGTCLG